MTLYVLKNKEVTTEPPDEGELLGTLAKTDLVYTRKKSSSRITKDVEYTAYYFTSEPEKGLYVIDNFNILMKPVLQGINIYNEFWMLNTKVNPDYTHTWINGKTITGGTGELNDPIQIFDPEEKEMQIETNVTLIDGKDATNYTPSQLLAFIREIEEQISSYKEIKTESNYINSEIRKCQDNIKELVDILDSI